jgi:hypothetical protein
VDPELKCPYTGESIEILEIAGGTGYIGRVASPMGGYTTRIFQIKAQLIDFLRHRKGKLKGEPLYPKIEIRDREPPPSADRAARERQAERDLDEIAQVATDRAARVVHDKLGPDPR